jgi:hypothetical protein
MRFFLDSRGFPIKIVTFLTIEKVLSSKYAIYIKTEEGKK